MKKLIGIGTGPGPGELLTLGALRAIENCHHLFVPRNGKKTMALDTVLEVFNREELEEKIVYLDFPMGASNEQTYELARNTISDTLKDQEVGVFITIGDGSIYSTLLNMLGKMEGDLTVEMIPGIPSFVAAANAARWDLVRKDEEFTLMDGLEPERALTADSLAILKTKNPEDILDRLEAEGYDYVYLERVGHPSEFISKNRDEIVARKSYMSLILARKKEQ
ncbi:MAG: precorrin-2 C(20)-methyltransferase [Tissierellia bacterium]|nr:precorrin-2 C(20)-methyltransferase [Tissierellia bacterium]